MKESINKEKFDKDGIGGFEYEILVFKKHAKSGDKPIKKDSVFAKTIKQAREIIYKKYSTNNIQ